MRDIFMQPEELKKLVVQIQQHRTEKQTIELKLAKNGCPTKLFDTLSSFSNQDDGGTIIFGIDEKDYRVQGVYDAHDLQKCVTEQCKQMEPVVRALFTVCEIKGKVIVSAEIPAVELAYRPVFYKGSGRTKGAFIRVGESDEPMTEYEVYSYEAFRQKIEDDIRPVKQAKTSLFNKKQLERYLQEVKKERKNLAENVSDKEILDFMGVVSGGTPTLAGVMIFSPYPQAYFPQLCITAVSVPGTEIGELGSDSERFLDNKRITGTISDMLEEAVEFVRKNSRTKTIIDDKGQRSDKEEYPIKAVREAILNALVHRDYSIHTENTPISLVMFRDRMEIVNSGGIYGRVSVNDLGKVRPDTRNPRLANILELLKMTENRYSGIPTMRQEFAKEGLPEPIFSIRHGEFKVTMKNAIGNAMDKQNHTSEQRILEFCKTPKTRAELIEFTGKSRVYTMDKLVNPLVTSGKLKLELPDKPKSSKQRYIKG